MGQDQVATEQIKRKPQIPEWIWQVVAGASLSLAVWAHGKMVGYEVALAQHGLRIDRLEATSERFENKLDKIYESVRDFRK